MQLLFFPRGGPQGDKQSASLYIRIADAETRPQGWSVEFAFHFEVTNSKKRKTIRKESNGTLDAAQGDWGFHDMIALDMLPELSRWE